MGVTVLCRVASADGVRYETEKDGFPPRRNSPDLYLPTPPPSEKTGSKRVHAVEVGVARTWIDGKTPPPRPPPRILAWGVREKGPEALSGRKGGGCDGKESLGGPRVVWKGGGVLDALRICFRWVFFD